MSPIIQNILWGTAGIIAGIAVFKLLKRTPSNETNHKLTPSLEPLEPAKPDRISASNLDSTHISTNPHPQGSAKEAILSNICNLKPLFDSLWQGLPISKTINEAIININNKELMDLWVKIKKDPNSIIRIFAMWGIKKEDEIQFQAQPYHIDRYDTSEGDQISLNKIYKVVSPCWIYSTTNNTKNVIIKGKAKAI